MSVATQAVPRHREQRPRRVFVDGAAVFVLAFAVRFGMVLHTPGGPRGIFGYDPGVYYGGADALIHGRVPYSDFVLLHPPAILLVLSPFALIGRLTTDHTGYILANTAFNLLSAANAVLVWTIARRLGFGRVSALLGGVFYAVWWGALIAEFGLRLEPLGNFALLCGLLMLLGREEITRRRAVAAGVAFGAACCVKIWWAMPLVVVLLWLLARRGRRRRAAEFAAGAAAAVVVIAGPFFALARSWMWRRVVTDQLGRGVNVGARRRLDSLTGVGQAFPSLPRAGDLLLIAVTGLLVAAVAASAWQVPRARIVAVLLVLQLLLLGLAPSFFSFYSDYAAGALALAVAAAAEIHGGTVRAWIGRAAAGAAVTVSLVLTLVIVLTNSDAFVTRFPDRRFAAAVADFRCVMTDSPSVLIQVDHLSKNLANGCENWVDVTGRTYDVDKPLHGEQRRHNVRWQRDLLRYLLSGDAVILIRQDTGISPATRRAITANPVLIRSGRFAVYSVRHRTG